MIRGSNFQSGVTVAINGSLAAVTLVDSTRLNVVTPAGIAGGPYTVDITNPGGNLLSVASAFSYASAADPIVTSVSPSAGSTAGGQTIQILGSGFTAAMTVAFRADPLTGLGGTPAASVTFVDANTLEVVTPAMAKGARACSSRTRAAARPRSRRRRSRSPAQAAEEVAEAAPSATCRARGRGTRCRSARGSCCPCCGRWRTPGACAGGRSRSRRRACAERGEKIRGEGA